MRTYNIYAEDLNGKRRFIEKAVATNNGSGLFDLYADECGDEECIVIVPVEISEAAAVLGRKGGKSTSEAKKRASRENGKKRGANKMKKVQEMMKQEFIEAFKSADSETLVAQNIRKRYDPEGFYYAANAGDCDAEETLIAWFDDLDEFNYSQELEARI